MQHLYFLYVFITFSIGLISLGIITFVYLKTKEKLILYYLFLHISLTSQVLLKMFFLYMSGTNILSLHPIIFQLLRYADIVIAQYFLMASLPIFIHHLLSVPHAKMKNIIWISIAVMTYSFDNFVTFVVLDETIQRVGDRIENSIMLAVILYSFFIGLYYSRKIEDEVRKKLAVKLLIFLGLFLPSIIDDVLNLHIFKIKFYPILYSCLSIIFSHHLIVHFLSHYHVVSPSSSKDSAKEPATEEYPGSHFHEEVFRHYQISPREQEIVALVLDGCSNQQIAESLCISLSTVKTHLRNIYAKFEIKSRYELISCFQSPQKRNPFEADSLSAE